MQKTIQLTSEFHDAEVMAIDFSAVPTSLYISFKLQDGSRARLRLTNVLFLRVVDVGMQNTVLRLRAHSGGQCKPDQIREMLIWATSNSDSNSYLSERRCEEIIESVRSSTLTVVEIVPSVGLEAVAVCDSCAEVVWSEHLGAGAGAGL